MWFQAAFAKTKGIIKAAQAGAFLCGHKEMAQVCVTHALTLLTFCISLKSSPSTLLFFLYLRLCHVKSGFHISNTQIWVGRYAIDGTYRD
jgi:hypothetical protein